MIERALMTPDELKSLPKGTFCVMKTGFYPILVKLKLFFKWGIEFPKEIYTVPDKGNRTVSYANKKMLEDPIISMYPPKSVGEKVAAEKNGFSLAKSNEQRKDGDADERVRNDLP